MRFYTILTLLALFVGQRELRGNVIVNATGQRLAVQLDPERVDGLALTINLALPDVLEQYYRVVRLFLRTRRTRGATRVGAISKKSVRGEM